MKYEISHITNWKDIIPLLFDPLNIFIKFYCCSVSTFINPLSLFMNRDLRIGFYDEIIINNKVYA